MQIELQQNLPTCGFQALPSRVVPALAWVSSWSSIVLRFLHMCFVLSFFFPRGVGAFWLHVLPEYYTRPLTSSTTALVAVSELSHPYVLPSSQPKIYSKPRKCCKFPSRFVSCSIIFSSVFFRTQLGHFYGFFSHTHSITDPADATGNGIGKVQNRKGQVRLPSIANKKLKQQSRFVNRFVSKCSINLKYQFIKSFFLHHGQRKTPLFNSCH